jgi:hypothetical protein
MRDPPYCARRRRTDAAPEVYMVLGPSAHPRAHCAVPPHLLERIARHGSREQRNWALSTLARDTTVRTVRVQTSLLKPHQRATAIAAPTRPAGTPQPKRTIDDAAGSETLPGTVVRREGDPAPGRLRPRLH